MTHCYNCFSLFQFFFTFSFLFKFSCNKQIFQGNILYCQNGMIIDSQSQDIGALLHVWVALTCRNYHLNLVLGSELKRKGIKHLACN